MLNYAATARIRTNVLVPQSSPNHCQEQVPDSLVSMLSMLLTHPEFREGLIDAYEEFESNYEPAPFTEEEMIEEVEMNVSRAAIERGKKLSQFEGLEPPSYLCNLGWVIGTIAKGLTYDAGQQKAVCSEGPKGVSRSVKVAPRSIGTDGWPLDR